MEGVWIKDENVYGTPRLANDELPKAYVQEIILSNQLQFGGRSGS